MCIRDRFKSFEKLGLFVLSDHLHEDTVCDALVDVTLQTTTNRDSPIYSPPEVGVGYGGEPASGYGAPAPEPIFEVSSIGIEMGYMPFTITYN